MSWWKRWQSVKEPPGFVLALGGGGGRGLAHLGVLQVLEEHGLKPDAIVGTSIGALFGSMYALEPDANKLQEHVLSFLDSDDFGQLKLPELGDVSDKNNTWLARLGAAARQSVWFTRAATGIAVVDVNYLVEMANVLCAGRGFADIKIPLYLTAVTFPCGECHIFSKGDLAHSIAASMAIPGVFNPLEMNGERYVDGGLASELPAKEARMIAKPEQLVVAVNVGARPSRDDEPTNVIGMLDWTTRVKALYLREYKKGFADVLVEPLVGFTQWNDFSNPEQEIERGRQAASEQMPKLIDLLHG
ncbi:MAG: patatin-like phospholipase family protein [Mariprofundaceae bacterium]|nr:patatin-like phospholipase family protein [Mariprofundaceae bacterium]